MANMLWALQILIKNDMTCITINYYESLVYMFSLHFFKNLKIKYL